MLRLHSKTIMKINAVLWIFLILRFTKENHKKKIDDDEFFQWVCCHAKHRQRSEHLQLSVQLDITRYDLSVRTREQYIVKHNVSGNNTNNTETLNPCQVAHLNVGICQTYWISQVSLDTVKSSGSD